MLRISKGNTIFLVAYMLLCNGPFDSTKIADGETKEDMDREARSGGLGGRSCSRQHIRRHRLSRLFTQPLPGPSSFVSKTIRKQYILRENATRRRYGTSERLPDRGWKAQCHSKDAPSIVVFPVLSRCETATFRVALLPLQ
jgi:hypothetical protein